MVSVVVFHDLRGPKVSLSIIVSDEHVLIENIYTL